MPSSIVKSYAKKSNKSVEEVEKIWNKAKAEAKSKFNEKDPHFWAYVNGTVEKILGIKKEDIERMSFKDFLSE